mgnify:CR=1 FL=1
MSKLTERDVEFIRYLADLKVPYRRIAEFHLKGRISHMTAYRVVHGKNDTTSNTQPEVDLTRDEISEIQNHEPQNFLNWSKGLGTELSRYDRFKIIKNSSGGTKDLGIREKILHQFLERGLDPRLKKLLQKISRRLVSLNLQDDPYVGHSCGLLARRFYKAFGKKRKYMSYARSSDSIVSYVLQYDARYESRIKPNLKIDPKIVKLCARLTGVPAQRV